MPSKRLQWRSLVLGCFKATKNQSLESPNIVSKKSSSSRIFLSDLSLSDYSSVSIMSDLSNSLVGSNLRIFTYQELSEVTHNFSKSNYLGEGGFGKVYKGFIDDNLKRGLKAQTVAVKALNLDGKQGHREWLVRICWTLQISISPSILIPVFQVMNLTDSFFFVLHRLK